MKKTLILISIISFALTLGFSQDQEMKADSVYGFLDVDVPAIFPGCDKYEGFQKKLCSKEALDAYIDNIMEYPNSAKRKSLEGRCLIEYTILSDGSMTDIDLMKDIGEGCGKEALRIFDQLAASGSIWQPATKNKQQVSIRMKTAVKFYLSTKGIYSPIKSKKAAKAKAANFGVSNY